MSLVQSRRWIIDWMDTTGELNGMYSLIMSHRYENLLVTASKPLVPSPLHPRYLSPEQSATLSHLPPPSRRLSLPAIAATTSLYLPAHRPP